jgi:hypothetical protein
MEIMMVKNQKAQERPAISQVHISLPDLTDGGAEGSVFS